ncbi:MAG: transcriptional repressor [Firmicutes bacterium]|nr:transcriptional repressor [Bacillota bacterium]MCL1953531.1 transcriptional repressor [Bacillota bacterium]
MARNTLQRQIILDALNEHGQHPTADEIYNNISKKHPSISKATVYRNLGVAIENGDIQTAGIFNGAMRFDHRNTEHYHFVCEKCGKLVDIPKFNIPFDINTHSLKINKIDVTLRGLCNDCDV